MSSYAAFADYYDALMEMDYAAYADYLCELLRQLNHEPGITLDLACGTGSLTMELDKRGFDVYGIDGSPDMLSVAQQKAAEAQRSILFLCQKMQSIDLYGTINTVFCALDSINHMTRLQDVQKTFDRVSLFLEPGGYFIFDVNTVYKHSTVLGENTFVYDTDQVFCVWQNHYEPQDHLVEITLDFFEEEDQVYYRRSEQFQERAYPLEQLQTMLKQAGLEPEAVYDGLTFDPPKAESQRLLIVAKKPNV